MCPGAVHDFAVMVDLDKKALSLALDGREVLAPLVKNQFGAAWPGAR
jgi:hypothetical protein